MHGPNTINEYIKHPTESSLLDQLVAAKKQTLQVQVSINIALH